MPVTAVRQRRPDVSRLSRQPTGVGAAVAGAPAGADGVRAVSAARAARRAALKPYRKFSHGRCRDSVAGTSRRGADRIPSECDRQKVAELTPDGRLGPSRSVTYSAHSWATRSMNSGRVNPLRHQLSARTCSADGCGSVRLVMAKPDLRSSSV